MRRNGPNPNRFTGRHQPGRFNLTLQDHAILSSDGHVIAIRKYHTAWGKSMSCVQPIPDDVPVKVGWWWSGGKFMKEKPNDQ